MIATTEITCYLVAANGATSRTVISVVHCRVLSGCNSARSFSFSLKTESVPTMLTNVAIAEIKI